MKVAIVTIAIAVSLGRTSAIESQVSTCSQASGDCQHPSENGDTLGNTMLQTKRTKFAGLAAESTSVEEDSDGEEMEDSYVLVGSNMRCHSRHRRTDSWGDLGTGLSDKECEDRCSALTDCNFYSLRTAKGECTSFTACDTKQTLDGYTIMEKHMREEVEDSYVLVGSDMRCHSKHRRTDSWGDLGTGLSDKECEDRCSALTDCNFYSMRTAKGECTSFTACDTKQTLDGYTIMEKNAASQGGDEIEVCSQGAIVGSDSWWTCHHSNMQTCGGSCCCGSGYSYSTSTGYCEECGEACSQGAIAGSDSWWTCSHSNMRPCGANCCCDSGYSYKTSTGYCEMCEEAVTPSLSPTPPPSLPPTPSPTQAPPPPTLAPTLSPTPSPEEEATPAPTPRAVIGNPGTTCRARPSKGRPSPRSHYLREPSDSVNCRNPGGRRPVFQYGEKCRLLCNTKADPPLAGSGVFISCLGDNKWGDIETGVLDQWSGQDCWVADEFDAYYHTLPRPTLEERKCNDPKAEQTAVESIDLNTDRGKEWSDAEKAEVKQILFDTFYENRGKNVFNADLPTAARVVRLGFHDCVKYEDGTGGCDGCIDMHEIDYRPTLQSENGRTDPSVRTDKPAWMNGNRGLEYTVRFIEEEIFKKPLDSLNGRSLKQTGKSRADLWAFTLLVAIDFSTGVNNRHCKEPDLDSGSPNVVCLQDGDPRGCHVTLPRDFVFQTGRRDCKTNLSPAYSAEKRDILPSADMSGGQLTAWFKKHFHFTGEESVAIMGAHTLGNYHHWITGYWYTVTTQAEDAFNNQYYRNLASYDDWFFEPSGHLKRGMKGRFTCKKTGTPEGKRPHTWWKMKAQSAWKDLTPIQWIRHHMVCPNCDWADLDAWPASFGPESEYVKTSCREYDQCQADNTCPKRDPALEAKNIAQCKPGTEYARFVWGRDDAATHADMGMYYDFLVDKDGFPYNCPALDKETGDVFTTNGLYGKGNWDYLHKRSNFNIDHGCGLQQHAEPCGSTPLYQLVEEFAEDKDKWLQVFVPTVEKMLRNGYGDGQLRDNGGVSDVRVTGDSGALYWMKNTP